jgi:hypothetical protein
MSVQTFVFPLYSHDPSSHVSFPYSPASGMVRNVQRSFPVRASKPRT